MTPVCPACGASAPAPRLTEDYYQPAQKRYYKLYRCAACGVDFSDPMLNPPPGTYALLYPGVEGFPGLKADWRAETFFKKVPAPLKVLDIGCGWGVFVHLALLKGYDASGTDYSPEKIRVAETLAPGRIRAASISDFLKEGLSGSWGAVTMFDVLEHLDNPLETAREALRLLKPGGLLAVTVPDRRGCKALTNRHYDSPPHHLTRWDPGALKGFLERAGFRVLLIENQALSLLELLSRFTAPLMTAASGAAAVFNGPVSSGPAPAAGTGAARKPAGGRKAVAALLKVLFSALCLIPAAALYAWCLLFKPHGPALFALAARTDQIARISAPATQDR
ncbi:MAG: hypothetical protein A2081_04355 [Elusimicrobia bacterium GWC2_61_19]|nr:MAG: hypothetical protein A2081_04355 [Elusimicrobia bacterium GWC2_61_19]